MSCRYYENKYPEVDDLVVVQVKSIAEMGAYVKLLEYDNIEGMILLSELSRRRIRSVQKLIRVGRNEVVVVLRVDKEKGKNTNARVSPEEIVKAEDKYNKAKAVHSIMRNVAEKQSLPLEAIYEKVGWPLYKKYGHAYEAFRIAITNSDSVFEGIEAPSSNVLPELISQIARRLTPQPVKIRTDIEVKCHGYDGVAGIKAALKMAEQFSSEEVPITVKLVAAPVYVITTSALDKAEGIKKLEQALVEIEKKILTYDGGKFEVKMAPRAISESDDLELQALMARSERENAEVSGDEYAEENSEEDPLLAGNRPRTIPMDFIANLLHRTEPESDESSMGTLEHFQSLLRSRRPSGDPVSAKKVAKTASRVRFVIERLIDCELDQEEIVKPNSRIMTKNVVALVEDIGGPAIHDRACIVFALLICRRYFQRQLVTDLTDTDVNLPRVVACDILAKRILEKTTDKNFLFQEVLLKKYQVIHGNRTTEPLNAIELAIDIRAIRVISSGPFQQCMLSLWRGYYQTYYGPQGQQEYRPYEKLISTKFSDHWDPHRMKTPRYQNIVQLVVSFLFLILYSLSVNTIDKNRNMDVFEFLLYVLVLSHIFDEGAKIWKVGYPIMNFWNVFNQIMYGLYVVAFGYRIASILDANEERAAFLSLRGYQWLAALSPMMWIRLLLYLDEFKKALKDSVVKEMMKESAVFFTLLILVGAGFLQTFIGLDSADGKPGEVTMSIIHSFLQAILQSPDFGFYSGFGEPFGPILYYIFTFTVSLILLNILIALFNLSYSNVTANAVDEFLCLFSAKTLSFIRAPDEHTFIPPLNLVEVFFLIPLEPIISRQCYVKLNIFVMQIVYAPCLFLIAYYESQIQAPKIRKNRMLGEEDGSDTSDWESGEEDHNEDEDWKKGILPRLPKAEEDEFIIISKVKEQISRLTELVSELKGSHGIQDQNFT
ncbi:Eukaryotic translation initiation factor 2 subunit alpha [Neolecta irregularis DAH-3]|uniref:Eukaryotic translation initiation factor 2 subunit alpha n=1 Tax=Neolecta irregularis (strain DAH-3) TaxID=1198029 RepID=A0A1U7LSV2_NEOID|nr:Eukaryotic translation initiation factor 2 subunit alpha [Neolecta irregularis DAH-3]|eukprot:OLL25622.1 Eukaryotic translation initiation factor 2 subunit alpha [Neolecta irregularis DAH-3]